MPSRPFAPLDRLHAIIVIATRAGIVVAGVLIVSALVA